MTLSQKQPKLSILIFILISITCGFTTILLSILLKKSLFGLLLILFIVFIMLYSIKVALFKNKKLNSYKNHKNKDLEKGNIFYEFNW